MNIIITDNVINFLIIQIYSTRKSYVEDIFEKKFIAKEFFLVETTL